MGEYNYLIIFAYIGLIRGILKVKPDLTIFLAHFLTSGKRLAPPGGEFLPSISDVDSFPLPLILALGRELVTS